MRFIKDYWLSEDGADFTPAINRCAAAAESLGEIMQLPPGKLFLKSRPNDFFAAQTLEGEGYSSVRKGTCVIPLFTEFNPEAAVFTWRPINPYHGTGGGARRFTLTRLNGFSGGTGIKVVSPNSVDLRSGDFTIEDVAILCESVVVPPFVKQSTWAHCLVVDGSNVVSRTSPGLRLVTVRGLWCSGAEDWTVELRKAVHFFWHGGTVQGGPTQTNQDRVGINIYGADTQDLDLNLSVYGTLAIRDGKEFTFKGKCAGLYLAGGGKVQDGQVFVVGCHSVENLTRPEDGVKVTWGKRPELVAP